MTAKPPFNSIWDLQQQYFADAGINAWSKGEVPHYVTSNPVVAKTYAELVYAFLCDLAETHPVTEKIYLLELGAGHGRFCYHFLKHLDQLTTGQSLPGFCYVLSDFSEGVLDHWKTHPRLQVFYEKGQLDYCLLNALNADELSLRISHKVIQKGSLHEPLVVIANYFFDTIPQDFYFVHDHQLYACDIETVLPEDWTGMTPKELISEINVKAGSRSLLQQPPYTESFLNRLIEQYAGILETDTYLLFPHVGLQCISNLSHLSKQGALLLTGDRGYHRLSELENKPFPSMAKHGSFSYPVNYHAFKLFCADLGGVYFFPTHRHESITHGCLLLLKDADRFTKTKLAYERLVNDFGPDDFYILKQLFVSGGHQLNLHELLACLRLSGYDARFFMQLLPRLTELGATADEEERWDIFQVLHKIWDMYYPLGEEDNLAFSIGVLLFNLHFPQEAITYFTLSEKLYGSSSNHTYNIALCYYQLKHHTKALTIAKETFAKDPEHVLNIELLQFLENAN